MAIAGKDGKVMIGINAVADIKSWSLDISHDMLEDTAMGDSSKTFISGLLESSATADGTWVISTDTNGQTALQTAFLAGTSVSIKLHVDTTHYYSGTAYISSLSVENDVADLVTVSLEFQGSGAISYT